MHARDWLRENGYGDIAGLIDEVMADLEAHGSKQRRNWWEVLAGGVNGRPLRCLGTGVSGATGRAAAAGQALEPERNQPQPEGASSRPAPRPMEALSLTRTASHYGDTNHKWGIWRAGEFTRGNTPRLFRLALAVAMSTRAVGWVGA